MSNAPSPDKPAPVRMRQHSWLRLLVAAQVLVLLGIAALAWGTDRWGQTIRLRTLPADPRNILYGDYVRLTYDISQLDSTHWRGPGPLPPKGSPVWVLLRESRPAWELVGAFGTAPAAGPGQAVLRGLVIRSGPRVVSRRSIRDDEYPWRIDVQYGLERYYLPEGTGGKLEAAARDSAGLLVRVQVAPWGTVRLQGVEL